MTWVPIWVNVLESRDSPRISTRAPPGSSGGSFGGAAVMAGGIDRLPIWVNVLESCELPVMMMVPTRACSAGVSAGVSTWSHHPLQLRGQRRSARSGCCSRTPGPLQRPLGAGVAVAAGHQHLLAQLIQLGADARHPLAADAPVATTL